MMLQTRCAGSQYFPVGHVYAFCGSQRARIESPIHRQERGPNLLPEVANLIFNCHRWNSSQQFGNSIATHPRRPRDMPPTRASARRDSSAELNNSWADDAKSRQDSVDDSPPWSKVNARRITSLFGRSARPLEPIRRLLRSGGLIRSRPVDPAKQYTTRPLQVDELQRSQ